MNRDLTLAESIVERVVDQLGTHAQPGGCAAVEDHQRLLSLVLLIAVDIGNFVEGAQLPLHFRRPGIQLGEIHALERVLILCAAGAAADPQILNAPAAPSGRQEPWRAWDGDAR